MLGSPGRDAHSGGEDGWRLGRDGGGPNGSSVDAGGLADAGAFVDGLGCGVRDGMED